MKKYYIKLFYSDAACTPKTIKVSKFFFKREFRNKLNSIRSYYDSGWQRFDVNALKKTANINALFIYKAN